MLITCQAYWDELENRPVRLKLHILLKVQDGKTLIGVTQTKVLFSDPSAFHMVTYQNQQLHPDRRRKEHLNGFIVQFRLQLL